MAYIKNIWVDQDVERPKTYEVTNNQDGSITLTDSFGLVTELGTPVNEVNMNHIEDGIEGCAIRKHNLTETFNEGEWVLGGTGNNEGIYKSLIANNVGNAITDNTAWEKVDLVDISSRADVNFSNVTDTAKIMMANASMPSDTYDDLTLGATTSSYTAPADGYVVLKLYANSTPNYLGLALSTGFEIQHGNIPVNNYLSAYLPVKKNDNFSIYYYGVIAYGDSRFRFYYAKGSESEAS